MHLYFKYDTIFVADLYGICNGSPCKSHTDRPLILYLLLTISEAVSHEPVWCQVYLNYGNKNTQNIYYALFLHVLKPCFPRITVSSFVLSFVFINYCMEVKNLI